MRHGDLYRAGDEFNREPWYHCFKCNVAHGIDVAHCDGLREMPVNGLFSWERDPYGVPTGYVPRQNAPTAALGALAKPYTPTDPRAELERRLLQPDPEMTHFKGLSNLICHPTTPTDSEILAKVRALVDRYAAAGYIDVAVLRGIVHPAQDGSTR